MIRTRGLYRALGIVIGRTLGTQVSCDAKEAPQRRRPITSARGQRATAIIAEDVEHVNNSTNEECLELKLSSYGRKAKTAENVIPIGVTPTMSIMATCTCLFCRYYL
ncbi:hypothetical protein GmHk_16G045805 [Glycine max]|nr:hypothetical protein GmHk_16G045805 [Glycine max]